MKTTSHKISDSLFLVAQEFDTSQAEEKPAEVPVNHVIVIDCSGSMWGDIPLIRDQLKRKVPKLLGDKDTLTIIWFSGRGQFGTLLEAEPIATLNDLQDVNKTIDRWLKPLGLTGFKEPLGEVSAVISRVSKKNSNPFSLFFMSDGCDNQWGRQDILNAAEKAASGLSSATFVEYGYYADRPMLTAMAEKTGGNLIFAKDFDSYSPMFEDSIQKKVSGAPRVEVDISGDAVGGFSFAMVDNELYSFEVASGKSMVPKDLSTLYYLSPTPVGTLGDDLEKLSKAASKKKAEPNVVVDATYASVALFSLRAQPKVVYPLLKALGDVQFIEQFGGCFGKQKFTDFMESTKKAAFGDGRFQDGWNPKKVPRDDAFTVLDVLRLLNSDDDNRVLLDSKNFTYSRISRDRVDTSDQLTEEERQQVDSLTVLMANEKDKKKLAELKKDLESIVSKKQKPLKFVADEEKDGYEVNNLVFNESRPNVSFSVKKHGTVDLSERSLPESKKAKLPVKFPTYVFRNYTVIRDGIVNVAKLPVKLSAKSMKSLHSEIKAGRAPVKLIEKHGDETVLNLGLLPIINANMVKEVSAKDLFLKQWALTKARASQKVFNTIKKDNVKVVSKGFKEVYGDDVAAWLQEQGITDYRGFAPPHTTQAESTDFYVAKELNLSIKSYSSIPSYADFQKRLASGKMTPSAALMADAHNEAEAFFNSDTYKNASNKSNLLETWIKDKFKESQKEVRGLLFEMSQIRFGVIVGQSWFKEFASVEENSLTIDVDGLTLQCSANMVETEVKI